jgi:TPP-dependent pyruvate/acetoin dehydrogenase alpha subunit
MCFEDVFEKFARGGLAAFRHPEIGDDAVAVGAPDAGDEDGVFGHDEMAG